MRPRISIRGFVRPSVRPSVGRSRVSRKSRIQVNSTKFNKIHAFSQLLAEWRPCYHWCSSVNKDKTRTYTQKDQSRVALQSDPEIWLPQNLVKFCKRKMAMYGTASVANGWAGAVMRFRQLMAIVLNAWMDRNLPLPVTELLSLSSWASFSAMESTCFIGTNLSNSF